MTNHEEEVNPIRGDRGARIFGPRNTPIAKQNPDVLTPPSADGGTMSNMKWPFELSHTRVESGGFSRETTVRELPISTTLAGVNMHLEPGAVRELHWHKEAEWAYIYAHSASLCQCNSRTAPGSKCIFTPANVVEIGSSRTVVSREKPPDSTRV